MKPKLLKITATVIAVQLLTGVAFSNVPEKRQGPVVVALVPVSANPSDQFRELTERVESELGRTRGIRLSDRDQTNAIIDYYRQHDATTTSEISQKPSLTSAREMFREGRFREADKYLDDIEAALEDPDTVHPQGEDLAQVHILRAKILHSRGDAAAVREQLEKLVKINPTYEFDPKLYGKWAVNGLKQAKAEVLKAGMGRLTVNSEPAACDVFINGFRRGLTPLTLDDLPVGRHIVELRTVNFKPILHEIAVSAGDQIVLKDKLKRETTASKTPRFAALNSVAFATDETLSALITVLGSQLGADKVLLLSEGKDGAFSYRLGDSHLGAIQKLHQIDLSHNEGSKDIAAIAQAINAEARTDLLNNPDRYALQTVGSVALHEKRKSPFYKKPLFWVLVGAGAGTGGILSAVLGGAAAVIGPGGVLIGF